MTTLTAEQKTIEAAGSSILGRPRRITGKISSLPSEHGVRQLVMAYKAAKTGAVVNDFQFVPGMVYTAVRAISARINQNYDAWPSEELSKSYQTFLGKPVFVNHANFDPERARGRVVAAQYVQREADKYIETIMETDALRYPKLGTELRTGGLDSVSMGVEAGFTICSFCGNKATDIFDMCDHVKFHKGSHLPHPETGKPVLVYENCYKLGFFELSYVFDPADETAVVNKVVVAGKAVQKKAWGETRAPEDIDTLRTDDKGSAEDYDFVEPYEGDDEDPNIPFAAEIPTIPELRTPDFDQTKRLDRAQEDQGLDNDRRVEDVEEVGVPDDEQEQPVPQRPTAARRSRRNTMGRTKYAAEGDTDDGRPPWLDDRRDEDSEDHDDRADDRDDDRDDEDSDDDHDDEDRRDEESDREDDDDDDSQEAPPQFAARKRAPARRSRQSSRRRVAEEEEDSDDSDDDDEDDKDSDDDDDGKPPWLKDKESSRRTRRPVNSRSSTQKKRKGTSKGAPPMGTPTLSARSKTAAGRRRHHFADDSGNTDGGPYGDNSLGEQAETYVPARFEGEGISDHSADGVPSEEPVDVPDGDGPKEPNSETSLVARRKAAMLAKIKADQAALQRTIAAYQRMAEGVEEPTVTNPELSGTEDQSLRGDDFQTTGLSDTETQPDDGGRSASNDHSRHWFGEFDKWVRQVTGGKKDWKRLSSGQLTRAASQWSKATGVPLDAMFPTLETALRQARKAEDARRAAMNRTADESLDVAAPDGRVDVERPVSDETDERAQASQFDLDEFGHNADDQDADPEMSVDSQIWAPGEAPGTTASREIRADGMSATRLAEAYMAVNLVPPGAKWKVAAWLQAEVSQATVDDRTKLLEAVYAQNQHLFNPPARRHTAGNMRGPVPPGIGSGGGRMMTAQERFASELDDPRNDSMMWLSRR